MLISQAYAADTVATTAAPATVDPNAPAASTGESLAFNLGFMLLLFVFFYILMIRPQQKRMKEQQNMLTALTTGDRVITNGGLLGTIVKTTENSPEVEIEIASGVKVTVLRYSIYKKYEASEFAPKTNDKKAA